MIGLDNHAKTSIIHSYLDTLPKENVEKILNATGFQPGVSPYSADTVASGKHIRVVLQDTYRYDDPVMTGSYLQKQAAIFIVIDPNTPDSLDVQKLDDMVNLSFHQGKNQNLKCKLLINNSAKVSLESMNSIEKWAETN